MTNFQQILENPWFLAAAILWIVPWKAVALWRAARIGSKGWFIALLVVNTFGLLEATYIFYFSGKKRRPKRQGAVDKTGTNA